MPAFVYPNKQWVRKEQSDFGWDWGPAFSPTGPWRDGRLVQLKKNAGIHTINTDIDIYRKGQLNNYAPDQSQPWVVNASIDFIGNLPEGASLEVRIAEADNESKVLYAGPLGNISQSNMTITGSVTLDDKTPKLWWPVGMGWQGLYKIWVFIKSPEEGCSTLAAKRRTGFRTILLSNGNVTEAEIAQGKQPGSNWHFEINGNEFYVKGANFIPPEAFWPKVSKDQMQRMFESIKHQNLNMLRIWSSGAYLPDFVYDMADEHGILLWSEFQFGDSLYPDDPDFIDSVIGEATFNVRRVNHHPSLACWAGGNELENLVLVITERIVGEDEYPYWVGRYEHLFITTLFNVVAANTRSISYTPSSGNNGWMKIDLDLPVPMVQRYDNMTEGHVYGDTEHYNYNTDLAFNTSTYPVGRFATEFGFTSMPSLQSWQQAIDEEDMHFNSSVIVSRNHHYPPNGLEPNETKSLRGMGEMTGGVLSYYPKPNNEDSIANFSSWCQATQLFQGDFYESQIDFYRQGSGKPERQRGTLFWQLNDIWQTPSWAGLEYDGRWKVLPYVMRRAYQNMVVTTSWHETTRMLQVWVVSDLWESASGQVSLEWFDLKGNPLDQNLEFEKVLDFQVGALSSVKILESHVPENPDAILMLSLNAEGRLPNSASTTKLTHKNYFLPVAPKDTDFSDPGLNMSYDKTAGKFTVEATKAVSLYTWLTHPAGTLGFFDDNAFVLMPGEKKEIGFHLQVDETDGKWVGDVTLSSMWDLATA